MFTAIWRNITVRKMEKTMCAQASVNKRSFCSASQFYITVTRLKPDK